MGHMSNRDWKTYKNLVISNYWGLELQSEFQSQTRKEERQQKGYISISYKV